VPSWIIALTPLWAAIGGGIVVGIFRLVEHLRGERRPAPPTWPEMWARIDAQDARIEAMEEHNRERDQAVLSILTTVAESWPRDAPKPEFDQDAIGVLADTLPSWYLRQSRRTPHPRPS
jgi:hypothetical protein